MPDVVCIPMFGLMKHIGLALSFVLLLTCWSVIGYAQDGAVADAATIAARQELDERFRRLESAVESLQAAQLNIQKRLGSIADEILNLRGEVARKPNESVSRDELHSLERKIIELNEKREADKRLIVEQLDKLSHVTPVLPPVATPVKPSVTTQNSDQTGFEYVVQPRDNLSTIVRDFNAEFKKKGMKGALTVQQVMKANDIKKASNLRVGQKLFIPDPSQP